MSYLTHHPLTIVFFGSSLLGGVLGTGVVQAACAAPEPVAWSYPQDGATRVPLDADLTIFGDTQAQRIWLNGGLLSSQSCSYSFDLGQLELDTSYVVDVETESGMDAISFHTGDGDDEMTCETGEASSPELDCAVLIDAQRCQAGDGAEIVLFWPENTDVLGWAIRDESQQYLTFWPSECGTPCLYTQSPEQDFELVEVNEDGEGKVLEDADFDDMQCGTICALDAGPRRAGLPSLVFACLVVSVFWYRRRSLQC